MYIFAIENMPLLNFDGFYPESNILFAFLQDEPTVLAAGGRGVAKLMLENLQLDLEMKLDLLCKFVPNLLLELY